VSEQTDDVHTHYRSVLDQDLVTTVLDDMTELRRRCAAAA
jgi:hypothetical protein